MSLIQRRLVFLAVLGLVAGLAVTLLRREDDARLLAMEKADAQGRVFDCSGHGALTGFVLANEHGTFELQHRAASAEPNSVAQASWQLLAPLPLRAETLIAEAITEAACALRRQHWVEPPTSQGSLDPKAFHLEQPSASLTLQFADHSEQTLLAGDKNPFDGGLYVSHKAKPEAVMVVDGSFLFQLDKDLFALRDKKLFELDERAVEEVLLTSNVSDIAAFRLAKDKDHQQFVLSTLGQGDETFGEQTPADPQASTGLLSALTNMRAKAFVSEHPAAAELTHFGLSRPFLTVALKDEQGTSHRLRLGRVHAGSETHFFAQRQDADHPVAALPSDLVIDKLTRGTQQLRDMRVLHLDLEKVARLELEHGQDKLVFIKRAATPQDVAAAKNLERSIEQDASMWFFAQGSDSPPLEQGDVYGLLYRLANMRAESQATRHASANQLKQWHLDTPRISVTFGDSEGNVLASLAVGEREGELRLLTDHDRQVVSRIFSATFDDIDWTGRSFAVASQPPPAGTP